jgi:hypothetical protein
VEIKHVDACTMDFCGDLQRIVTAFKKEEQRRKI